MFRPVVAEDLLGGDRSEVQRREVVLGGGAPVGDSHNVGVETHAKGKHGVLGACGQRALGGDVGEAHHLPPSRHDPFRCLIGLHGDAEDPGDDIGGSRGDNAKRGAGER